MAPLPYWRARLAPGLSPTDVSDKELADSLAKHITGWRLSKAETLREAADALDAELAENGDPDPDPDDPWRQGMNRAITALRSRADEVDDLDDRTTAAHRLREAAAILTVQLRSDDQSHSWRQGMTVAITVLIARADDLDPARSSG